MVIQLGETITIAGVVERVASPPAGESGYRDGGQTLRLVGDFDRPLLVG